MMYNDIQHPILSVPCDTCNNPILAKHAEMRNFITDLSWHIDNYGEGDATFLFARRAKKIISDAQPGERNNNEKI